MRAQQPNSGPLISCKQCGPILVQLGYVDWSEPDQPKIYPESKASPRTRKYVKWIRRQDFHVVEAEGGKWAGSPESPLIDGELFTVECNCGITHRFVLGASRPIVGVGVFFDDHPANPFTSIALLTPNVRYSLPSVTQRRHIDSAIIRAVDAGFTYGEAEDIINNFHGSGREKARNLDRLVMKCGLIPGFARETQSGR